MSLFISERERRLWIGTLVAVAAIYATLGLASVLAGIFYNQGLSAIAFLAAMLLIGVTVLTQGLKVRPAGLEVGVALGIAVVYFMVFFRMAVPERSHLIEYSVVAVLIYEALTERKSQGGRVPVPALLAIAATSLIGALDEYIQVFLPHRVFDPIDILFNTLAAVMAVVGMVVLGWARRLTRRMRRQGGSGRTV